MTPTKAERARFDAFQRIGCVACHIEGLPVTFADVHHLLSGGRRRGHTHTIPLCPWHHRGMTTLISRAAATIAFGPSLANGSKAFHARYGSDAELLALTEQRIEQATKGVLP